MIFVSLANIDFGAVLNCLQHETHAEIRLDKLSLTVKQVTEIFNKPCNLIATCRPGTYTDRQRKKLLKAAVDGGAKFIDIEIESKTGFIREMVTYANEHDCGIIISHHDYHETPSIDKLEAITRKCFKYGATVAKVVTMINSDVDRAKILSLYSLGKNIVAFGMGEKGKLTRILSLPMGAPFTYASPDQGMETAPGQLDRKTMEEKINLLNLI